jgi:TPR repeat protein
MRFLVRGQEIIDSGGRRAVLRSVIILIPALAMASIALAQNPDPPQKPLRERLLERANKGDAEAQFELGKNYEAGRIGLPRDFSLAEHWYREAANQGDPYAAASLGILLNFGKGIQRDYVQAFVWYDRAASRLTGGSRDSVVEMRDNVASKLTTAQLQEARRLVKEWAPTPTRPQE